jgi:NAD(P)-dependent dehydrogenase (short-subunit alcohol dehydrogenase family)
MLPDKAALVTGAASGIGRATALTFAREGARVLCADLDEGGADRTAREIRGGGGESLARRADVAREDEVEALVRSRASRSTRSGARSK